MKIGLALTLDGEPVHVGDDGGVVYIEDLERALKPVNHAKLIEVLKDALKEVKTVGRARAKRMKRCTCGPTLQTLGVHSSECPTWEEK